MGGCGGRQGRWIGAVGHPVDLKRRVRYYPNGPLADSYHRGRRGKYLRCCYDSIRLSPRIIVTDVRYLYEEAVQAGSDHALVVANVELTYRERSMSRKNRYDQSAMPLLRRV